MCVCVYVTETRAPPPSNPTCAARARARGPASNSYIEKHYTLFGGSHAGRGGLVVVVVVVGLSLVFLVRFGSTAASAWLCSDVTDVAPRGGWGEPGTRAGVVFGCADCRCRTPLRI